MQIVAAQNVVALKVEAKVIVVSCIDVGEWRTNFSAPRPLGHFLTELLKTGGGIGQPAPSGSKTRMGTPP